MLRPGLSEHDRNEALRLLTEVSRTITSIGEITLVDHKVDGRYVNLIFDIGKIKQELHNANSNRRRNP